MQTAETQESLNVLRRELERKRREFATALAAYQQAGGRYIDRAPQAPQALLSGCEFVTNRFALLELLPKESIVGEVGTDEGAFASRILATCRPREFHVFELDTSRIKPEHLAEPIRSRRCQLHAGDSSTALQSMPENYFDWLYIDGDHSYEGVKLDIEAAAPRVKPGGFLVFNDYAVWSVSSMRRCGVARAANEFAARERWRFRYLAFQTSMYLDVALVKPRSSDE